jgi:hypothetical protein
LLLFTYVILAVGYSLVDPIFEPPDEHLHFAYVRYLVEHRRLPQLVEGQLTEYHQPPLYYAAAALINAWVPADDFPRLLGLRNPFTRFNHGELSRDNKNLWLHGPWDAFPYRGTALAVHLIRLFTVLTGAGAVWVTGRLAADLFDHPAAGLGAAAFVAFNPMFLLLSGAVHNDPLIALEGGALLWASLGVVRHGLGARRAVVLGLIAGLSWLTKVTSVFLLPAVELAITWAAWRRRSLRGWLGFNLTFLATGLLVAGWLFVRNLAIYGDPTAVQADLTIWGSRSPAEGLAVLASELLFAWTGFWGRFGYSQVPLPNPVYGLLSLLGLAALVGIGRWVSRVARHEPDLVPDPAGVAILGLATLSLLAALIGYILFSPAGMFGRYTFPALAATASLLFFGLSRLVPERRIGELALACNLGMATLAIVALVFYLGRIYAPPPALSAGAPSVGDAGASAPTGAIPHRLDVRFGGVARLLGYTVAARRVQPGDRVAVTLYWEPLARAPENYVVFVHLANDDGLIAAQRDTHPGLGTYPTGAWTPGHAFADTYQVEIPATAYAPDATYVEVGLYDLATGRRLPAIGPAGEPLGEALRLAPLPVEPRPGELPNPTQVNFADQLVLTGYQLDRRNVAPGETIRLTLYWRVLRTPHHNLSVFAHVLGANQQIWAYGDGRPHAGQGRTATWRPSALIEDVRELPIVESAPPGVYDLEVGWFDPRDHNERLRLRNPDGAPGPDRVLLARVRVRPP